MWEDKAIETLAKWSTQFWSFFGIDMSKRVDQEVGMFCFVILLFMVFFISIMVLQSWYLRHRKKIMLQKEQERLERGYEPIERVLS